jgi:hypothetical protein
MAMRLLARISARSNYCPDLLFPTKSNIRKIMIFSTKPWRLATVTFLTILAVAITGATQSFAADGRQPGEDANYVSEGIATSNTINDTRTDDGTVISVWRGFADDHVWVRVGASTFTIGNTHTNVAPNVVAYGDGGAAIFHTGTDHRIYWSYNNTPANHTSWTSWAPVGNNFTAQTPSITRVGGQGSRQLYMAYRGDSTPQNDDNRIFVTYYDAINWDETRAIPYGASPSAPAVVWNVTSPNNWGNIYCVIRGTDNRVYTAALRVGGNDWGSWREIPSDPNTHQLTNASPAITRNIAGTLQVAVTNPDDGRVHMQNYDPSDGSWGIGWTTDASGWQTRFAPALSQLARTLSMYLLFTGNNGEAYWKQSYNS